MASFAVLMMVVRTVVGFCLLSTNCCAVVTAFWDAVTGIAVVVFICCVRVERTLDVVFIAVATV